MSELNASEPLLAVRDLQVHFPVREGVLQRVVGQVKAVDGISFEVPRGSTVGLVGESGSGKTTTGRAIARLTPITSGCVRYAGQDLSTVSKAAYFPYRKKIQMIFQDPFSSLNPRMSIYSSVAEPLDIHFKQLSKSQKEERVSQLLEKVGLEADFMRRYPHQFSGGQRQRISIARALSSQPEVIICDEPTSALDVSVQAQVLNLLKALQKDFGLTYLFITHDLAVVSTMANRIGVLNQGVLVEEQDTADLFSKPQQDYTKMLLSAAPKIEFS